ncbi:MAG: hypothetical protein RJA44_818 [Pseudomonadota bacterium]|jgi:hypothetical protein
MRLSSSRHLYWFFLLLALLGFIQSVHWWSQHQGRIAKEEQQRTTARDDRITKAADHLDKVLKGYALATDKLADRHSSRDERTRNRAQLLKELKTLAGSESDLFGAWVAEAEYQGPQSSLMACRRSGKVEDCPSSAYDYTKKDSEQCRNGECDWFLHATRRGHWVPLYSDRDTGLEMISYTRQIDDPGRAGAAPAVFGIDITTDQLRRILDGMDLGGLSTASLVATDGTFVVHPDPAYNGRSIEDYAKHLEKLADISLTAHPDEHLWAEGQRTLARLWRTLDPLAKGLVERHNEHARANQISSLITVPLPTLSWTLVIGHEAEDIEQTIDLGHQELMHIILALTLSASLLCVAGFGLWAPERWSAWGMALGTAFCASAGMAGIWLLVLLSPTSSHSLSPSATPSARTAGCGGDQRQERGLPGLARINSRGGPCQAESAQPEATAASLPFAGPILNGSRLRRWRDEYADAQKPLPAPLYVPTGVFIQSINYTSSNDVRVTGYLWQRLRPEDLAGDEGARKCDKSQPCCNDPKGPTILMPEATEFSANQAYNRADTRQGVTACVVGWSFAATLRQSFDYQHYPFDRQNVWLRLRPGSIGENVVLVPDLHAYDNLTPASLPGLEHDFVLPGWILDSTYYSYERNSYNSNFGLTQFVAQENAPELYFNVNMKRTFMTPFVAQMIPVVVVLLLTFAVLLVSAREEPLMALHGFSSIGVLSYCSALFLAVVLSHTDLRRQLMAADVIYLEYFYITTYLAILAVAVNTLLYASGSSMRWVQHRDNLMPKLLFWPVMQGVLFAITYAVFRSTTGTAA